MGFERSFRTPKSVRDGAITMGQGVVCWGGENKLVVWDQQSGEDLGHATLEGMVQPGMAVQSRRILVRLRRPQVGRQRARDVLQAVNLADLTVLWEFESSAVSPGSFGVDSFTVAFPGSADEVVTFR